LALFAAAQGWVLSGDPKAAVLNAATAGIGAALLLSTGVLGQAGRGVRAAAAGPLVVMGVSALILLHPRWGRGWVGPAVLVAALVVLQWRGWLVRPADWRAGRRWWGKRRGRLKRL
jgi:hypothetical protein